MAETYRLVGPPGCGKTAYIRRQVEVWSDQYGYAPGDFVLTSLTRAAANVLRGRVDVPKSNVSTLHSFCYRGLGSPPVAEVGALRKQWNEYVTSKGVDAWSLEKEGNIHDDVYRERIREHGTGQMLSAYSLWRVTGRKNALLAETTRAFAKYWEGFKKDTQSVDFTDMLEMGLRDLPSCPGEPAVICVDEAQDLTPLQWRILHQWAEHTERVIIAGDPAQALYGFAGAGPEELLSEIPQEHYRLLSQSYRLPSDVLTYAESWLGQHSPPMTSARTYRPVADSPGIVERSEATWEHPEELLAEIDLHARIGRTVMVLASCSYMLAPIVGLLRDAGIPFHNPYRPTQGAWNPGSKESKEAAFSLLTGEGDWWSWGQHLPARHFVGYKKDAAGQPASKVLQAEAYQRLSGGQADTRWYLSEVLGERKAIAYELACMGAGWTEKHVIVGTSHSVKGGEADVVIIFPDVSPAAQQEIDGSTAGFDAAIRLFYVGLTRSRDQVILCAPVKPRQAIWWPQEERHIEELK